MEPALNWLAFFVVNLKTACFLSFSNKSIFYYLKHLPSFCAHSLIAESCLTSREKETSKASVYWHRSPLNDKLHET